MKILLVDFSLPFLLKDANYPVGGWAVEQDAWIAGLRELGHEVKVASWLGAGKYTGSDLFLDLYDPDKGIPYLKIFYIHFPAIFRCVKEYRPDLIMQGVRGTITGFFSLSAKLLGIPFVYRVTSDADVDERYRDYLGVTASFFYKKGLDYAPLVVCQNDYQRQQIETLYQYKKATAIVNNPFQFFPVDSLAVRKERNYIAWLANFSSKKNLKLLAAIARKLPEIPFKVGGQLVGSGDQETLDAILQLKQLPNVELMGCVARTDIAPFFNSAILLLNTSRMEGFSNTFLEAFCSGTPVVCRRAVDPGHIVERQKLGRVADDEAGLVVAIQEIVMMESSEYFALAHSCKDYVMQFHAPIDKAKELLDVVMRLEKSKLKSL